MPMLDPQVSTKQTNLLTMSSAHATSFHSAEIGATGVWIATDTALSSSIRKEIEAFAEATPNLGATRGVADVAADIGAMVASGVIGNAAWSALPLTAEYLRMRFGARSETPIAHQQALDAVIDAARAAYGAQAGVHVRRAEQMVDGTWDVTFSVGNAQMFARVQGDGRLILWTE
jgi:hypothetical protein